jgi:hypothetical protein
MLNVHVEPLDRTIDHFSRKLLTGGDAEDAGYRITTHESQFTPFPSSLRTSGLTRHLYLVTRGLRLTIARFDFIVSAALRATGGQIPNRKMLGPLFRPSARYPVTRILSLVNQFSGRLPVYSRT